jgi:molybdopterin synthase catalytic subunit
MRARADRPIRSTTTLPGVAPPEDGDNWLGLTDQELPIAAAYQWALRPNCGAVVLFSGTVRDHAEGRTDVQHLTYEAYTEQVEPTFVTIMTELRDRWPDTGRVVLLHRTGRLCLEESSVIAIVSAPHRPEAFEAARYAIDALKSSAPIWKHEVWAEGADWGTDAHVVNDPRSVGSV